MTTSHDKRAEIFQGFQIHCQKFVQGLIIQTVGRSYVNMFNLKAFDEQFRPDILRDHGVDVEPDIFQSLRHRQGRSLMVSLVQNQATRVDPQALELWAMLSNGTDVDELAKVGICERCQPGTKSDEGRD